MSVSIGCGPLPSFIYDRYLHEPLMEGVHQTQYVKKEFGNLSKKGFSVQVLRNIVMHSVQGAFLLVPAINVIAFRVFLALKVTIKQSFERSVAKGDQQQVGNYLESGMDPNAKNLSGVPLLFQSLDSQIIRTLIKGKADPKATDSSGGTFLEHLLLNGKVELAEELAREKLFEVRLYLTETFFDKVQENRECRSFLLRWGYDAPIDTRCRFEYDLKTELPLENAIMTGNVSYLKARVNNLGSFRVAQQELVQLKEAIPHLRTEWIWGYFLQGYLEGFGDDEEVIRGILTTESKAQTSKIAGQDLLIHLCLRGNSVFARKLCEEKMVNPEPYYSKELFQRGSPAVKTLLLQIGYPATLEERHGTRHAYITANPLEQYIMTGQGDSLEQMLNLAEFFVLDEGLAQLKDQLPLLNTDWIWEHVLVGYCRGKDLGAVNGEWIMQLLKRGGKVEALNGIRLVGNGELLQRLVASGKQDLASSLVACRFLSVDPFFQDSFLNPAVATRMTNVSRDFVWFLVTMGYEKAIKTAYAGHYQQEKPVNILEKALVTCDGAALVQALERSSMGEVIEAYEELKAHFPRLNSSWAWDHLAEDCFGKGRYEDFLTLVNQGLYQPTDAFYNAHKPAGAVMYDSGSAEGYKTLMKVGYRHGPLLRKQYGEELFEFTNIAYCHDVEGLQRLARDHGFQVIYDRFKDLKSEFPKMETQWFWNALFTIPSTHFEQYRGIQADLEVPTPPKSYNMRELKEFFNKIDFSEISKAACTDTLGNAKVIRSKEDLRVGINKVVDGIRSGHNIYAISADAKALYVKQLNWILYYLEKDLGESQYLSESAGTIFVEMLKDCLVCHSRWNEVFDVSRKRLGNIVISAHGFEQQLQTSLGQARGNIVDRLTAAHRSDTHVKDNLIHFLRGSRALPQQPVHGRLVGGYYAYNTSSTAHDAFDNLYTPGTIREALFEFLGGNKDFYELMLDTFGTRIAPQWHGQNLELRRKVEEIGLGKTLTIAALQEIGLTVSSESYSQEDFFSFLQEYGVTPKETLEQAKEEYVLRTKADLDKAFKDKWYPIGVAKEVYTGAEDLDRLSKAAIYFKVRSAARDRSNEFESDWRRAPGDFETLLGVADHFDCTAGTLSAFYEAHPEIPEDVRRKVPTEEIKKQLIYIAYQMKYGMASLPVGSYLAAEEKGIFTQCVIPMKGYEVALKGDIHPLVLAKLNAPSQKGISPQPRMERRELIKIFVALAALYSTYRWARSSVVGSPTWIYNKIRRTPEAQKV